MWQEKLKIYLSHPISWITFGLVPCVLVLFSTITAHRQLDELTNRVLFFKKKKTLMQKQINQEQKLVEQLKSTDRDYVETQLESLRFLEPECQKLQALLLSDSNKLMHQQRLDFLQGEKNTLRFKEKDFQRMDHYQEVDLLQEHPVEMNRGDLKKLLARIENVQIDTYQPGKNPPDFLIKNFELIKKPLSTTEETFVIQLELIKREIVHE